MATVQKLVPGERTSTIPVVASSRKRGFSTSKIASASRIDSKSPPAMLAVAERWANHAPGLSTMSVTRRLTSLRIVVFESRRAKEAAEMIRRHDGEPVSAPSLREVPLSENEPAFEFARALGRGDIDLVILLTGVGTRYLAQAVCSRMAKEDFVRALASTTTVARGPKPVAALRELGLRPTISVPEPNTWRELLATLDEHIELPGKRVAVQEYGERNPGLIAGLHERGAEVMTVPIYRWSLPEDLEPLREAIRQILDGRIDIALLTSAIQVDHLFQVAGAERADALRAAFASIVVASIGPISSIAIQRRGLPVDLEPDHPKMGALIAAVADRGPALVEAKRRP